MAGACLSLLLGVVGVAVAAGGHRGMHQDQPVTTLGPLIVNGIRQGLPSTHGVRLSVPGAHPTSRPGAYDPAAPWTAPAGTLFPYAGLENDLGKLLEVQASPFGWISMVTATAKIMRFVLNCLYSLHKYGHQPHYIVATFDAVSLAECKKRNLPCFKADAFAPHEIEDGDHGFGSHHAVGMWWAKQNLTRELISRGYNVHGSDVDVVYFRNLNLSYNRIFGELHADGIFAAEESGPAEPFVPWKSYINLINAGVYALQSNNRTLDLLNKWLGPEGQGSMDQVHLNNLNSVAYVLCDSHSTCRSAQSHNRFALYRHEMFFPGTSCMHNFGPDDGCNPRRLYLHYLCACCWQAKSESWDTNKLWFVDNSTAHAPMWEDGGGPLGPHPFMPCMEQVAWPGFRDRGWVGN